MAQAKTISLRRGAFKIKTWSAGSGRPLLYLHGIDGLNGWPSWLDGFTGAWRVVAPQQPGFGSSTGLDHLESFLDLSLFYLDLIEALGMERPAIIGHGLGGNIAAELAAINPHAVDKLVLVAPTGLWNDEDPGVDVFAITEPEMTKIAWHDPEGAVKRGLVKIPKTDNQKRAAILDRAKALSTAGKFLWPIPDKGLDRRAYRITAPTLLVWGASDKIVPPSYAPLFRKLIAGSKVVRIPRAGHSPMLEQPGRFVAAVKEFLT